MPTALSSSKLIMEPQLAWDLPRRLKLAQKLPDNMWNRRSHDGSTSGPTVSGNPCMSQMGIRVKYQCQENRDCRIPVHLGKVMG